MTHFLNALDEVAQNTTTYDEIHDEWATKESHQVVLRESFPFFEIGVGAMDGVDGVADEIEELAVQDTTVHNQEQSANEDSIGEVVIVAIPSRIKVGNAEDDKQVHEAIQNVVTIAAYVI